MGVSRSESTGDKRNYNYTMKVSLPYQVKLKQISDKDGSVSLTFRNGLYEMRQKSQQYL
jgi:hypothetical protein